MRAAIIDGDTFVYSAALRSEEATEWDDGLWTLHAFLDTGIRHMEDLLHSVKVGLDAARVVVALSDYSEPGWRMLVDPEYKAHRKATRRPVIWAPLRDYLRETYEVFSKPTLEGDDIVGILATNPKLDLGSERVVVSIDKDMKTLPGKYLRWDTALREVGDPEAGELLPFVLDISEADADRFHLIQTIAGDTVDGYAGAPGWGMVTAARQLESGRVVERALHTITRGPRKGQEEWRVNKEGPEGTPWEIVVSIYESCGLTEEVALRNARVARICRWTDYNYATKEVKLWLP